MPGDATNGRPAFQKAIKGLNWGRSEWQIKSIVNLVSKLCFRIQSNNMFCNSGKWTKSDLSGDTKCNLAFSEIDWKQFFLNFQFCFCNLLPIIRRGNELSTITILMQNITWVEQLKIAQVISRINFYIGDLIYCKIKDHWLANFYIPHYLTSLIYI